MANLILNNIRHVRYLVNRYILARHYSAYDALCPIEDVTPEPVQKSTFFGYYNISPVNFKNQLIYCAVDSEHIRGGLDDQTKIRLVDGGTELNEIAETGAWNWQQGCMLQWLPPKFDQIIFNDFEKGIARYVSRVRDTRGKLIKTFAVPIYSISPTGTYALTLSFERLASMRPDYGYFCKNQNILIADDSDGIWLLDLATGKVRLVVSLQQLKDFCPVDTMKGAEHKVNHIDINPSGNRFMFLHRWVGPSGRFMRLITADPDGTQLQILNGDQMTSHSCWRDDEHIISFCHVTSQSNGYYEFTDKTNNVKLLSEKLPKADGHPSISPDGGFMITDTYPDKARMARLLLYNLRADELIELGRFYQPLRFLGETRIDLHPKCARDGESIFFESGHTGRRRLYRIDISQIVAR